MFKTLVFILFFSIQFSLAAQGTDKASLESKIAIAKPDTSKVHLLLDLAVSMRRSNPEKALEHANEALKLSKNLEYKVGLIRSNIEKKKCYFWLNQFQNAKQSATKALAYAKELNDPQWLVESYFNLGDINFSMSEYVESLRYHLEALKIAEHQKLTTRLLDLYNAVGIIYFRQKNYPKSEEYYLKELDKALLLNDSIYLASVYDNLAIVAENQMRFDEAIDLHKRAIQIAENLKDTTGIISGNNNLGLAYKKKGKYDEALKQYDITYKLLLQTKPVDSLWLSYTALNMGNAYTKIKDFTKAEKYLTDGCKYLEKVNDNMGVIDAYFNLFELSQAKGDYKNALNYHLKYIAIKDSTFTLEKSKQLSELQEKYNVEKKDFEIKSLNQKNAIKESEIKKERIFRNSLIGLFLLLIILMIVVYNRFLIKAKSQEELSKAHVDLKSTQQQLIQQEKLASLGSLTAGIAHEIKNPLNFVTNFSQLSTELIDELNESDDEEDKQDILKSLKSNLEKINHHGKRANSIVMSMLQHARGGEGEKQMTDINQICNEFADLSYQGMRSKIQDFNCEIERKLDPKLPLINVIPQDISRVILNLLNNAFYASNEKSMQVKQNQAAEPYRPVITITTLKQNEHVLIMIKDNGSGIPAHIKQKIFEPFFTTKPSGEGTGLGLSICNDIIKAHGGTMRVESETDKFTEFIITLPI